MKLIFLILVIATLFVLQFILVTEQSEGETDMKSEVTQFDVQHILLSQLGEEHLANAVLRHEIKGDNIVAWGDRILQWRLAENAKMEEVFPPIKDTNYSNGGCVMDVDEDGNEEIIVARYEKSSGANLELFWFEQVSDSKSWVEHTDAHLDGGSSSSNTYHGFDAGTKYWWAGIMWSSGAKIFSEWQSFGLDKNGTLLDAGTPVLPANAVPFALSQYDQQ